MNGIARYVAPILMACVAIVVVSHKAISASNQSPVSIRTGGCGSLSEPLCLDCKGSVVAVWGPATPPIGLLVTETTNTVLPGFCDPNGGACLGVEHCEWDIEMSIVNNSSEKIYIVYGDGDDAVGPNGSIDWAPPNFDVACTGDADQEFTISLQVTRGGVTESFYELVATCKKCPAVY